jgi:hypothetical protein
MPPKKKMSKSKQDIDGDWSPHSAKASKKKASKKKEKKKQSVNKQSVKK